MKKPLLVEIVAYAPTAFYHCQHCEVAWREMGVDNRIHDEQTLSSLPEDLAQEYQNISDWVREVFRRYCDNVMVKVIDAASVEGFFKTLRYKLRHYPAVVIDGEARFGKNALVEASQMIVHRLDEDAVEPAKTV